MHNSNIFKRFHDHLEFTVFIMFDYNMKVLVTNLFFPVKCIVVDETTDINHYSHYYNQSIHPPIYITFPISYCVYYLWELPSFIFQKSPKIITSYAINYLSCNNINGFDNLSDYMAAMFVYTCFWYYWFRFVVIVVCFFVFLAINNLTWI